MSFAALIDPWSLEQFRAEIWGQQVLHLTGGDRVRSGPNVTGDEVRSLLFAGEGLPLEAVHLAHGANSCETPVAAGLERKVADPAQLAALFGSGQTIMVERVERFVPGVANWARAVSRELRARTAVHLIISPAGQPGFAPHSDGYGVFALQIEGSKNWSIYGDVPSTAPRHGVNRHDLLMQAPTQVITMRPSDVLYLPRGVVHAAAGLQGASIHLSLAVMPAQGSDLIALLACAAERDRFFRQELPFGTGPDSALAQEYLAQLADRLAMLIDNTAWFEIIDARLAEEQNRGQSS